MAETYRTTFKLRRGHAEVWEENNPVLQEGEPGFALDTKVLKIGDGTTSWLELEPVNGEYEGLFPDWSHLKWYVMGDSLTDRNNNHTVKRYYDFVQEKTGIQIILDGKGGTGYGAGRSTGTNFVERVKNIPDDVDIVTIFGSVNDIRYAGDTYGSDIWDTLSWLALNKPGLRVIVVPPALCKSNSEYDLTKRGTLWKSYCDRLQLCALAADFRYVSDMFDCPPFNPNFDGHMEKFFTTDSEGIHPNEEGHKALAPYFYNALSQELIFK